MSFFNWISLCFRWLADQVGATICTVVALGLGCAALTSSLGCIESEAGLSFSTTPEVPDAYRTLAEHVDLNLRSSPDDFRFDRSVKELLAESHIAALDLRGVSTSDEELSYLAEQAIAAHEAYIAGLERFDALPKPSASDFWGQVIVGAARKRPDIVIGAVGNAKAQQDALNVELASIWSAIERVDVLRQMLPRYAEQYSAEMSDEPGRIELDFDETWGGFSTHDQLELFNTGAAIQDCTIVVDLVGADGETRRNVHFLREWPANGRLYSAYLDGTEFQGELKQRLTVVRVEQIDVTVYSPSFATKVAYRYDGAELEEDMQRRCDQVTFEMRRQAFQKGIFYNTDPGVKIKMIEGADLPGCEVELTFRKGEQSATLSDEVESWKLNKEWIFTTGKDNLDFTPTEIEMRLKFPRSESRYDYTAKFE